MPPPTPNVTVRRRQTDRRAETRRKLLDATIASLIANGYAGTTVDAIVTAAGVTRGALNHHFAGKIDLMLAAAGRMTDKFAVKLSDRLGRLSGSDPYESVPRALWEAIYSDTMFVARLELLLGARGQPDFHAAAKGELLRGHQSVHALLAEALAKSGFEDLMPPEAVDLALTNLRGMALERLIRQDEGFVDRQLRLLADSLRGLMSARPAATG